MVGTRLGQVRERIQAAGGDPSSVAVIAVTKGYPVSAAAAALANGLSDLGENYGQELLAKSENLSEMSGATSARWHFLGAIQRRKIRPLAPLVSCWQGVSRLVEAQEIARRRGGAKILVEVETTNLPGRSGCPLDAVAELVGRARHLDVDVRGLMTVAPPDRAAAGRSFELVTQLADRLQLPERSMGMSDDLEEAVKAGTTMIRVGRALFGSGRAPRFQPLG